MTAAVVALSQLYTHRPSSLLSVLSAVTLARFPPPAFLHLLRISRSEGSAGQRPQGARSAPGCCSCCSGRAVRGPQERGHHLCTCDGACRLERPPYSSHWSALRWVMLKVNKSWAGEPTPDNFDNLFTAAADITVGASLVGAVLLQGLRSGR